MSDPVPIPDLLQRFQAGDQQAAEQLFARYAQRLTRLAEQHLSRKLAGRVDGEDVVQSVFRTFFRRSAGGEFQIDSSAQVWRLLVKITLLKVRAKGRYHTADKRDAGAEQPTGAADWLPQAVARDPGPDEAAMLVDQIEALLRGLPELHAQVLERRLQGHHVTDIAAQLDVSRQTVHRVLNLLQQRLNDASAEPAE
ncbi:MAG TPA: ECF-type sigma factor [Gemmataceae bacterium]|nr:ECF-type sigma factor [Gemmataceae bacterium]